MWHQQWYWSIPAPNHDIVLWPMWVLHILNMHWSRSAGWHPTTGCPGSRWHVSAAFPQLTISKLSYTKTKQKTPPKGHQCDSDSKIARAIAPLGVLTGNLGIQEHTVSHISYVSTGLSAGKEGAVEYGDCSYTLNYEVPSLTVQLSVPTFSCRRPSLL